MDNVDNVEQIIFGRFFKIGKYLKIGEIARKKNKLIEKINKKEIHIVIHIQNVDNHVDDVDNYIPKRDSPMFTTFPAPIVINKSPLTQFSNKKFSISSKLGK